MTGLVQGERPLGTRVFLGHPPLRDVTVSVIGGAAVGSSTRTREDGTYDLSVPRGTFKLRFERPGFALSESRDMAMPSNGQIAVPDTVLLTAPWTVAGVVTDSVGTPVPDAEVTIKPGDALNTSYGSLRTDGTGRYRFASTRPHFDYVFIRASKLGFEPLPEQRVSCCDTGGDTVHDFRLVRVISITPTAPSSLRVGESLEMPASVVVFDNGVTRNIFVLPTSSAPSVIDVARSSHWYAMRGVTTGVATLTFELWGAIATTQVRVVP